MAAFFENLWGSIFTPGATPTLLIATNVTFAALQTTLALLLVATYSIHFVALSAICGGLWWAINWFAAELAQAERAEQEAGRLRKRRAGIMDEKREHDRDTTDYASTDTEVEGKSVGGVQIRGGPGKIQAVLDSANSTDEEFQAPRSIQTRGGPGKAQAVMDSAGAAQEEHEGQHGQMRIRGGTQKILGVMNSAKEAQAERDEAATNSSGFQAPVTRGGPGKILGVLGMSPEEFEAKNPLSKTSSQEGTSNKAETGSVSTDSEWEKVDER